MWVSHFARGSELSASKPPLGTKLGTAAVTAQASYPGGITEVSLSDNCNQPANIAGCAEQPKTHLIQTALPEASANFCIKVSPPGGTLHAQALHLRAVLPTASA